MARQIDFNEWALGRGYSLVDNMCSRDKRERRIEKVDIRKFFEAMVNPDTPENEVADLLVQTRMSYGTNSLVNAKWPHRVIGLRYLLVADERIPIIEKLEAFERVISFTTNARAHLLKSPATFDTIRNLIAMDGDVAAIISQLLILVSVNLNKESGATCTGDWGTAPAILNDKLLENCLRAALSYYSDLQEREADFNSELVNTLLRLKGGINPRERISSAEHTCLKRKVEELNSKLEEATSQLQDRAQENEELKDKFNKLKARGTALHRAWANPQNRLGFRLLVLYLTFDSDITRCNFKKYQKDQVFMNFLDVVYQHKGKKSPSNPSSITTSVKRELTAFKDVIQSFREHVAYPRASSRLKPGSTEYEGQLKKYEQFILNAMGAAGTPHIPKELKAAIESVGTTPASRQE